MNVAVSQNPKLDLRAVGEPGTPVARLIGKLVAAYPNRVTGTDLAQVVNRYGAGDPFASLCFNFLRANEALAPYGWQAGRSGGTPHDTYFLRPHNNKSALTRAG